MKKILLIASALMLLVACENGKRIIIGDAGHLDGEKIYFYELDDNSRIRLIPIDSADIENNKFRLVNRMSDKLIFAGTSPDNGAYLFIGGEHMDMKAGKDASGDTEWIVEGSPNDKLYREFLHRQYIVTERQITDSLDRLFYQARDIGDREEMARIKEESIVYYERGSENEQKLIEEMVAKNHDSPFGIYLYYTYAFRRKDFPTQETVNGERDYILGFGQKAQATTYYPRMHEVLDKYMACAVGAIAPDIAGADTLDNPLKLSDLRGNYVIVDFWDSYCHWCRKETPYLQKALDRFRESNFRILGVSSDREKERWIEAIRKDNSYWDHLLLPKDNNIYDTYCIKAVPHLILVDPEGKILAKNLRWEDHIKVTEKYLK